MKSSADTPIYNLKAVVQETGLKPDTLRAWERRYGLPDTQRTDSGHRLYSQNDIELLKWLMARQEEGMSISRAVELWRRLEAESHVPLRVAASSNGAAPAPPVSAVPSRAATAQRHEAQDTLSQLREEWIAACLAFDEQRAEQVATQAFALFPVEKACVELLQQGLAEIGDGWYDGTITVQQEHFTSALATRRLETLLTATPPPTRPGRILIGCPPEEVHTFVPLMISLLLRRRSWDVVFLGANVPVEDFVLTVQTTKPQLVLLTAQLLSTAVGLRELGELIYDAAVPMGYGGLVFTQLPELQNHITGHYLGDTITGAIAVIEQLMIAPHLPMPVAPLSHHHEEALAQFRSHQAQIEVELWRNFGNSGMSHPMLRKANINFSRDIIAALAMGDIRFLGIDLAWVQGLLMNHYQMPKSMVIEYLQAYLQAAESVLNGQGPMLINWLKQILQPQVETVPLHIYAQSNQKG
ncbi:MAG: MerR family transcriptional regulator [Caldilineaceae bacterium]|nr:MerR family transcriptional regulator [Caldilineaceae bacterium]